MKPLFAARLTNALFAISAIATFTLPSTASVQAYPNKPVRMIVGFPAGTGPDLIARVMAQKMQEQSLCASLWTTNLALAG